MTNTIKPIPGLDIYVTMVAVPHDGKTDYYFFASDQNKDWTIAEVRAIQTKAASTDARVTQMAGPYPTPRAAYAAAKALLTDGVRQLRCGTCGGPTASYRWPFALVRDP